MIEVFQNQMPNDEAIHAKKCQFEYEICTQHCQYQSTEKCMGVEFCMKREGFI